MVAHEAGEGGREGDVGTVLELLPRSVYRIELANRKQVLAHAAGRRMVNFVRLRPGDRVRVTLAPHDPTRARITELLDRD